MTHVSLAAFVAALALSVLSSDAFAQAPPSVETVVKVWKTDRAVRDVLSAQLNALAAANLHLSTRKLRPLFCPPQRMTLTTEQAMDILERYLVGSSETVKKSSATNTTLVLIAALEDVFPCS